MLVNLGIEEPTARLAIGALSETEVEIFNRHAAEIEPGSRLSDILANMARDRVCYTPEWVRDSILAKPPREHGDNPFEWSVSIEGFLYRQRKEAIYDDMPTNSPNGP